MKITIVEDELLLASNLAIKLKRNGFVSDVYNTFNSFKNTEAYESDLYIIDISLGDGNGLELIDWLRKEKKSNAPIIITSGHTETTSVVEGLNIGADDYITKPYDPNELIARVRASIRRSYKVVDTTNLVYKDLVFDTNTRALFKKGEEIILTSRETQMVEYLLYNVGKLVDKVTFINSIWGHYSPHRVTDNNVNVVISRVRKKLGEEFKFKTVVNKGYILEK